MSLDADALVERRRLRRKVSFWRASAVLLVAATVAVAALASTGRLTPGGTEHVARVTVSGFIGGQNATARMLKQIGESRARAVIVRVNSPGGGMAASEAIYDALRDLNAKKPVVAVFDSLAASGGYMVGIGAERIFAGRTTITGSIGVLVQYPNFSGLLETVGVEVEAVRSSPIKAQPDGLGPTPPEARAVLETLVADSHRIFRNTVGERRNLSGAALDAVTDGRVMIGERALAMGLVDELGGEDEARAWLAREKNVPAELPIREWRPARSSWARLGVASSLFARAADALGWRGLAADIRSGAADGGVLDGLLAVWHPAVEK